MTQNIELDKWRMPPFLLAIVTIVAVSAALFTVFTYNSTSSKVDDAVAAVNTYWTKCLGSWAQADGQRTKYLGHLADKAAAARTKMDDAMDVLVALRGEPNSQASRDAQAAHKAASVERKDADWMLSEARRLNPAPQLAKFCKPIKGLVLPKVPPVRKPDLSQLPSARLAVFLNPSTYARSEATTTVRTVMAASRS